MRKTLFIIGCIATLLLSACTGESSRPVATGEGHIRALNTIPTAPNIVFMIEERALGFLPYAGSAAPAIYDDLQYIFNFEAQFPGELTRRRVASSEIKIEKDREYTFLVTGDLEAPTIIVWDEISRTWEGSETVFQVKFGHTSESLGPIDVYWAAPGVAPALGEEKGTLAFGEILAPVDYDAVEFAYTITTAGDPGDILFTSNGITPFPASGFTITVFDGSPNDVSPISARILTDTGAVSKLSGANSEPTIRFFHASATMGVSDVYTDDLLLDQILANHSFRDITGDIDLASASYPITYTAAGNVGSILHEGGADLFRENRYQYYIVGGDLALTSYSISPDRRSVETQVKFSFVHTSVNHPVVDLYVVEAGTDISDPLVLPTIFAASPVSGELRTTIRTGDLEIYLTPNLEKTIITGPIALTTSLGDVIELISYDNVDPATVDLVFVPIP